MTSFPPRCVSVSGNEKKSQICRAQAPGREEGGVTKSLILSHGVISLYEDNKRVGGRVDAVKWGQEFNKSMIAVWMYVCVLDPDPFIDPLPEFGYAMVGTDTISMTSMYP